MTGVEERDVSPVPDYAGLLRLDTEGLDQLVSEGIKTGALQVEGE